MSTLDIATKAKAAASKLQGLGEETRQKALRAIAVRLRRRGDDLMEVNREDVLEAQKDGVSKVLIERLAIGAKHIEAMAIALEDIAAQPAVVGMIVEDHKRQDGLIIQKQRIPIGVIGMIFESRPNVVIDAAALAIKSGNALVLKGGKEAHRSNAWLYQCVVDSTSDFLPKGWLGLLETREDVSELLKLNTLVDLMVPRGGEKLIKFVRENATMPVVAHDRGLCHAYVHHDADPVAVEKIIINAKTQRPGVCNALETLLVHEKFPLGNLLEKLKSLGVTIHTDEFDTEWLDLHLSFKAVKDVKEAVAHIQKHGTRHTEAFLGQEPEALEYFLNHIDASCIAINASTRFNDGSELGLGAELGISTSKLHAYGPMGAREMTTTRFIVKGQGHVRS